MNWYCLSVDDIRFEIKKACTCHSNLLTSFYESNISAGRKRALTSSQIKRKLNFWRVGADGVSECLEKGVLEINCVWYFEEISLWSDRRRLRSLRSESRFGRLRPLINLYAKKWVTRTYDIITHFLLSNYALVVGSLHQGWLDTCAHCVRLIC